MLVRELSMADCAKVLAQNRVGRLACCKDGRPYVVPINYVYADVHLYAFSLPGKKIEIMRSNPQVSMLVEEKEKDGWRSVLVEGRYEELPDRIGHKRERDHAWGLLSQHVNWWEPGGLKPMLPPISEESPHVFFRIFAEAMTGREARHAQD